MADDDKTPRPNQPSQVKIDGIDKADNLATRSIDGTVTVSAVLTDPQQNNVRLLLQWGVDVSDKGETFTLTEIRWGVQRHSEFVQSGNRATYKLTGLKRNTRYRVRMWAQDKAGHISKEQVAGAGSTSATFWTNRPPEPPTLVSPSDGQVFDVNLPVVLDWQHVDLDNDKQRAFKVRWRPSKSTGEWTVRTVGTLKDPRATIYTIPANDPSLKSGRYYDWQVATQDTQEVWGDWSFVRDFYMRGEQAPPTLLSPVNEAAVDVLRDNNFKWRFNDPDKGDVQKKADIRFRAITTAKVNVYRQPDMPWADGTSHPADDDALWYDTDSTLVYRWNDHSRNWVAIDWVTLPGNNTTPGPDSVLLIPEGTFQPGARYEWQARTYDTLTGGTVPSDWSESAFFNSILTPGWAVSDLPLISDNAPPLGSLGCGSHRAFVFTRGGVNRIGEITPLTRVIWNRKRDDMANAIIDTNGFGDDCCRLLAGLRSWMHELVIYRDKDRVFEGPITRITYTRDAVEVEAKDVMAYPYRRILKQGYNESFHLVKRNAADPGTQLGLGTVVDRALQILSDALAYDDPNVLPYLTAFRYPDDSQISSVVYDYSKTAWEEIDNLAATAGLDYTTVGRRIMLWDTHKSIGKLPEMRDEDFLDPPVVTEYGMQTANLFAVTNNSGLWGDAIPDGRTRDNMFAFYGPVEQLASAFGEAPAAPGTTMTTAARDALVQTLNSQARRNISDRWPTPLVVRVPDNSALNPEVNLGIQQLIPGVWIPLRSVGTCRPVAQWQKLDSVTVEEVGGTEQVRVVMSPAPNGGQDDPDSNTTGED